MEEINTSELKIPLALSDGIRMSRQAPGVPIIVK